MCYDSLTSPISEIQHVQRTLQKIFHREAILNEKSSNEEENVTTGLSMNLRRRYN